MKRQDIIKKFDYVSKEVPTFKKDGECFEIPNSSIKQQVLGCDEGKDKIFYFKYENSSEDGEVNIRLISEEIFISPSEY